MVSWYNGFLISKTDYLVGRYSEKEMSSLKLEIKNVLPILLSLIMPGLSLYANPDVAAFDGVRFFLSWLVASIILYLMWYLLWNIWDIQSNYKIGWFVLALVVFIALIVGVIFFLLPKGIDVIRWYNVFRILVGAGLFLTIQFALKTQENISLLRLEKEQMQTENYRAQLKTLRAQIDPHFLFNSMNTLRTMVRHHHPNSEQFIMSLSDFYRQTLKHNEDATLQLSEELDVLKSYLFLMKSRNEQAVSVEVDIDSSLYPFHLPALALQIVAENCFKHNMMTSKMPLRIEIKNTEDHYIVVSNNIQPKIGESDPSGFGLDLLKKRYALMNIENSVITEQTPDQFIVKLKLIET